MEVIEELGSLKTIYGIESVKTINGLKKQMMVSEIKIRRKIKKSGAITRVTIRTQGSIPYLIFQTLVLMASGAIKMFVFKTWKLDTDYNLPG